MGLLESVGTGEVRLGLGTEVIGAGDVGVAVPVSEGDEESVLGPVLGDVLAEGDGSGDGVGIDGASGLGEGGGVGDGLGVFGGMGGSGACVAATTASMPRYLPRALTFSS